MMIRLALLLVAALALAACDFEPFQGGELSSSISVSPREIVVGTTVLNRATVRVQSPGDWIIIAPEGLVVEPLRGTGDTEVSVTVPSTLTDFPLTFYVCGTGVTVPVVIRRDTDS